MPFGQQPNWMGGGNSFYDPTSFYGGNGEDWWTPFVRDTLSTQPGMDRGVFERFLTNENMAGFNRRDMFARGQENRMDSGYKSALMTNPNLNRIDYMDEQQGQLRKAWAGLAPQQRGEFQPSQTRWVRW